MPFHYQPLLVLLSLLVAVQASFVGLSLAADVRKAEGLRRRALIAGSALSLGVGIWGMHFVGMLAATAGTPVDYVVLPTLISFLVAVLVAGVAVTAANLMPLGLWAAAPALGLGIAAMHFIGMMAVRSSLCTGQDEGFAASSVVVGVAAAALALKLALGSPERPRLIAGAVALGLGIAGLHYTAMLGVFRTASGLCTAPLEMALSSEWLAAIVALVAFAVSAVFMLTLVPGRAASTADSAPRSMPAAAVAPLSEPAAAPPASLPASESTLPIEVRGVSRAIGVKDVYAVHASGHYTYVFNGREDLFCPLTITEVADRLPRDAFFRIHRSHLVNLARVADVRRAGDQGVATLDSPAPRKVPISRNRLGDLRLELAQRSAVLAN